jgi:ParB family chromosome partitioning protein
MPHEDLSDGLRMDRAIDSITVGPRHRREVGDLSALCDSIARNGLLCPLTVTPDGLLLCGWRRLEAVKLLGWKTVPVFVRRASAGLRDVIAEHDENTIREPLPLQAAEELYREYKTIETEQAAVRQHATQFHTAKNHKGEDSNGAGKRDDNGPADSAAPGRKHGLPARHGDARAKAAQMVTGTKSYTRLEHTGRIKDTRDDPAVPDQIRAMAKAAWHDITVNGASPEKLWKQIRAAITAHESNHAEALAGDRLDDPTELAAIAQAALARPRPSKLADGDAGQVTAARLSQPLVEVVAHLDEWINHADVDTLVTGVSSGDLTRLHRVTEEFDRLCTAIHAAHHKRHPVLRREKPTATQGNTADESQPPLW